MYLYTITGLSKTYLFFTKKYSIKIPHVLNYTASVDSGALFVSLVEALGCHGDQLILAGHM